MQIVSAQEFKAKQKIYFELAEKERIVVKRGKKYVHLLTSSKPNENVIESWYTEYMKIPEKYRINPFEISPSGDLYYADKRNIEALDKAIEDAKKDRTRGETIKYEDSEHYV